MKKQQEEQFEEIVIELKHKMVVLKTLPFDTDIDVDSILRIDHSNIVGEILTFGVLYNRIGNLKAEMENIVAVSKVDLEAYESQLLFEKRKAIVAEGEKPTESTVDARIKNDPRYIAKKKLHLETVKNLGYLESIYWAAQAKIGLLRSLSDKLRPEEFSGEIISDTINGVMIKASKKLID